MKNLKIAILFVILLFGLATPVRANQILFQDDFNDGEFSNWVVKRNAQLLIPNQPCYWKGQATSWGIVNGELGIDIWSSPCMTEIAPKNVDVSAFAAYEVEFDWNLNFATAMDRGFGFNWKDVNNWYGIKLFDKSVFIQKVVNNVSYTLPNSGATYNFQPNQKYHFKISLTADKKITVSINGQSILQAVDESPFISGSKTIALQGGVGDAFFSSSYYDNVKVTAISDEKNLNVPLYKQSDTRWKEEEYDSAHSWVEEGEKTTIGRWGCAMTSMVMVMRYYGMNTLPDGRELTPSTLNAWLKEQADGYSKAGAINWNAVTRLTRLIGEKLGTPKLEYTKTVAGILTDLAKEEIRLDKPVIMEIVGHFLVGDGITDTQDLAIKDPAYSYLNFAKHKTNLISLRKFQPAHSDLSYITLYHEPQVQVVIKDTLGKTLPAETSLEQIPRFDENTQTSSTAKVIATTQIAKPSTGKYSIEINRSNMGKYNVEVFAYDQLGNVSTATYSGLVGTEPVKLEVEYQKGSSSTLKPRPKLTFALFRSYLKAFRAEGKITNVPLYTTLDAFTQLGEISGISRQLRYIQSLEWYIQASKGMFVGNTSNLLLEALHELI